MSPPTRRLAFDPARDGFSFPNAFRWTEADLGVLYRALRPLARGAAMALPATGGALTGGVRGLVAGAAVGAGLAALGVGEGLVRASARRWPTFGLCGGMALAAAERWPHRAGLVTSELRAEPIRRLLWRRQLRTLRAAGPVFLCHWLAARAGRPVPAADLLADWDALRAGLDAGRPVLVGLVGDAPDPFGQHQVLAYGYDAAESGGTLFVYDPNRPGEEHTLTVSVEEGHGVVTTDLAVGPTPSGFHIHTRPGRLHRIFPVAV